MATSFGTLEGKQLLRNLLNCGQDRDQELEHLVTQRKIDLNDCEAVGFDCFQLTSSIRFLISLYTS